MSFKARDERLTYADYNKVLKGEGYGDTPGSGECRVNLVGSKYKHQKYIDSAWVDIGSTPACYAGTIVMDDNSPAHFMFKIPTGFASIKIKLKGFYFPEYMYSELPGHEHGTWVATWDHYHGMGGHTHATGGLTIYDPGHLHADVEAGAASTASGGTNTYIYGSTAGPSNNNSEAASASTTTGGAGIAGVYLNDTKKTLLDTEIDIYITTNTSNWGTAKDKNTQGFSSLANINGDTGTDEIDISSYVSAGFNFIRIIEPTTKKGGTVCWHLEVN